MQTLKGLTGVQSHQRKSLEAGLMFAMPRQEPYAYSHLPIDFNEPDSDLNGLDPFEQRSRVEARHQKPSVLQEVPLLLLPQQLFALSRAQRQRCPETIAALEAWLIEARADDQRLRIRRPWIPFVEVYFPNTEAGRGHLSDGQRDRDDSLQNDANFGTRMTSTSAPK
jgi:hypothetical protein